jgi:hypothetical protein
MKKNSEIQPKRKSQNAPVQPVTRYDDKPASQTDSEKTSLNYIDREEARKLVDFALYKEAGEPMPLAKIFARLLDKTSEPSMKDSLHFLLEACYLNSQAEESHLRQFKDALRGAPIEKAKNHTLSGESKPLPVASKQEETNSPSRATSYPYIRLDEAADVITEATNTMDCENEGFARFLVSLLDKTTDDLLKEDLELLLQHLFIESIASQKPVEDYIETLRQGRSPREEVLAARNSQDNKPEQNIEDQDFAEVCRALAEPLQDFLDHPRVSEKAANAISEAFNELFNQIPTLSVTDGEFAADRLLQMAKGYEQTEKLRGGEHTI